MGMIADSIATHTMLVTFQGCLAMGRAAPFDGGILLRGKKLRRGGAELVEEQTEQDFDAEPGKDRVVAIVGQTIESA